MKPRLVEAIVVLALGIDAGALVAAADADRGVEQLLRGPEDPYRVEMRITSIWENGRRAVAQLQVESESAASGRRFGLRIQHAGRAERFCLLCTGEGRLNSCARRDSGLPPTLAGYLPGTLLPWEEIVAGACGQWTLNREEPAAAAAGTLPVPEYRIHYRPLSPGQSAHVGLIYTDTATGIPRRIEHRGNDGQILRTVQLLETGRVAGHLGIRRALITHAAGRALLEVRSAQIGPRPFDPIADP